MATHWVSILGKVEVADGQIKYVPITIPEGPNAGQQAVALVRSNLEFESGEISYEALLSDPTAACQVGLNQGLEPEVYAGLGAAAPYGVALFRNGKWEYLAGAGFGDLQTNEWIAVRVRVLGSKIDLYVNDVKVCSTMQNVFKGQVGLFIRSTAEVLVRNFAVVTQAPRAFVVMQFSEPFDALYNDVIKPTCEKFGFEVIRADDIYKSGLIIEDITRSIQESSFVIADITPDNPNVFYEVGYAHGIRKPTILLSERRRGSLPFDVSGFRTLFYDNTIGGKAEVEKSLTKHLQSMAV
ncbi:MAG: hypothetical protein ACD_74C00028G0005 [uncultured bacterium]|nr:MAG: hypothetical protein ACD_74C00028G0005 [uncultured bacterium]